RTKLRIFMKTSRKMVLLCSSVLSLATLLPISLKRREGLGPSLLTTSTNVSLPHRGEGKVSDPKEAQRDAPSEVQTDEETTVTQEASTSSAVTSSAGVVLEEFPTTPFVLENATKDLEEFSTSSPSGPSTTTTAVSQAKVPASRPACYVRMRFCRAWEGLAGILRYNQHVLAAAVKYNCAYVCEPVPNWKTASHDTGAVDDLFGCIDGRAVGDPRRIASARSVLKLPVVNAQFRIDDKFLTRYKTTGRVKEHLVTGPAISLNPRPSRLAVYQLTCPIASRVVSYEVTYPWLREQFAAARGTRDEQLIWRFGNFRWRIAIQLRRGDRPSQCPLGIYLNALRGLLRALPCLTEDNTEIIVVGEMDTETPEFDPLKHLNVHFLSGRKTRGKTAKQRLVRDLDHLSTSNILILGGGGGFAGLVGALQVEGGTVLHARTQNFALDGVPHAHKLDDSGRFMCAYDLKPLVRTIMGTDLESLSHMAPQSAEFLQKVEKSLEEYQVWYEAHGQPGNLNFSLQEMRTIPSGGVFYES
ncbi:unnamed protein product, partial [Durusdinium trenchii]